MEAILQQITDILCNIYPPNHISMYPIRQMGIKGTRVHHRDRKKELTYTDRKKLCDLSKQLLAIEIDPNNCKSIYYRSLIYDKLFNLIS